MDGVPCLSTERTPMRALISAAVSLAAACACASALPVVAVDVLARDFEWSRALLFSGISAGALLAAVTAPIGIWLITRMGLRNAIFVILIFLLTILVLSAVAPTPWAVAILWALSGAVSGCLSPMLLGPEMAARMCPRHCGLTSSLFSAVAFAGGLLSMPAFAFLSDTFGLFAAYAGGATALILALIGNAAVQSNKIRKGDFGEGPNKSRAKGEFLRSKDFWLLAFLTASCGVTSSSLVSNHLLGLCMSAGLSATAGANTVAATAVAMMLGAFLFGVSADRFSGAGILAGYYLLRAALLVWLPHSALSFQELSRFAILYGLDWAATMPMLARMALDRFGARQIGAVMSLLAVTHPGAAAIATFAVAAAGPQHFTTSFAIGASLCLLSALLVATRRRPAINTPDRYRTKAAAAGMVQARTSRMKCGIARSGG